MDGHAGAFFAAGYAACFGGSLDFMAKRKKRDAANAKNHLRRDDACAKVAGSDATIWT
jgi:organic hydroperoxide reductase OsmC/OhrA